MATACGATSSRCCLVASSSSRVRKSRTLTSTPQLGALSSSPTSSTCRVASTAASWNGLLFHNSHPVWIRRMSSNNSFQPSSTHRAAFLESGALSASTVLLSRLQLSYTTTAATATATATANDHHSSNKKQLSAMLALALGFVAAASTNTTTTTNHVGSSGPNPAAKFKGGGGPSRSKTNLLVPKQKAEEDVRKVEEDANKNPYTISECAFQGARWTMEDTYLVRNGGQFVAVFDGHGGDQVSLSLHDRMFELYTQELIKKHMENQNEFGAKRKRIPSKSSHVAALQRALEQVEEAVMREDDLVYQGSTAVCVVLHKAKDGRRTLLSANVGDSRAILGRSGKAVDLTRDHKPSDEQEKARITAMGEEIEWDPYGQIYRVRDLSLSRAIGDRFAKPVVTSDSEIMTFPVEDEDDDFILLASDGLWDVMTSQEVVDFVNEGLLSGESSSEEASQSDKRKNMARIVANEALERGSADNVCVIVVWLKEDR